jgi:HAE1 family hydrophobic/amphiphilic exporter-1
MLSTGMLVDNAVVVLESIYQKLEKGMDRLTAARIGTQEVITAVIAATLTSIIIFVPLVFGKATQFSIFLGQAGAAIILALCCSLFISLTLIPLTMARFLRLDVTERSAWQNRLLEGLAALAVRAHLRRGGSTLDSPRARAAGVGRGPITEAYLKMVTWPLNHRLLVGFLVIPLMVAGSIFWLMKKVPDNTPEATELGSLQISYKFTENFHYAKIEQDYVNPVERFLLDSKERFKIKDVQSWYGNDTANTQVFFDKGLVTAADMAQIREEIKKELPVIPGAEIGPGRQQGAQNSEWISVSLNGDDPETLQALAQEAKKRLVARNDVSDVYDQLSRAQEEVQIKLNRDLARKYNVSPQSVSGLLGIVVRGRQVRSFPTPEGEIEIWVKMHPDDLGDLSDLKSIIVGAAVLPEVMRGMTDASMTRRRSMPRRRRRSSTTDRSSCPIRQVPTG